MSSTKFSPTRLGFLGSHGAAEKEKKSTGNKLERGSSDLSGTSITSASASSSHHDIVGVFQKKKIPSASAKCKGNGAAAEKKTNFIPEIDDSTASIASPGKDLWQWHQSLVEAEAARRLAVERKLEDHAIEYSALQHLMNDALHETASACRWTTGMAKAQEQLALAHTLPPLEDDDEDLPTVGDDMVASVTADDSLPEKLRADGDEEDNETAEGALPGTVTPSPELVLVATPSPKTSSRSSSLSRDKLICNDGSQPPVFAISIPNPEASDEAFYVLHKQNDLLLQVFARTIPQSVERVHLIKELVAENVDKLHELAGSILDRLSTSEKEVQRLWGGLTCCDCVILIGLFFRSTHSPLPIYLRFSIRQTFTSPPRKLY